MTRYRVLVVVALAVLVLVPGRSLAGGGFVSVGASKPHGGGFKSGHAHFGGVRSRHGFGSRSFLHPAPSVFPTTIDPWKFWGVKKGVHRPFHKSAFVVPGAVFAGGTAIVYAPSAVYAAPEPVVYATPVMPPAAVYAPPPMPTVIDYPTGRYELRGDGVTSAYQWVWIPKPPPPPPPPEVAPEPGPQSRPPARERSIGTIYRWTDEEGVTTFTDRLENVPERYRSRAQPKA